MSSFSFNIFCFIHSLISETHSSIRARPSRQSLLEMIHCQYTTACHLHRNGWGQSMPLNDITNRFGVHANKFSDPTQNPVELQKGQLLIYWYRVFNNNTLYPTREIRPEPIRCIASLYCKHYIIVTARYCDLLCRTQQRDPTSANSLMSPPSNADRMSFWTLIKAVSVECLSLYADCSGSNRLLFIKCSLSPPWYHFFNDFRDKMLNLIQGENFFKISLSKPVFFKVVEWGQF